MSFAQKLKHELKAIAIAAVYFGIWLAVLMVLKQLILAEYQVEFSGLSAVIIGALIMSKVVLILELVPLGSWIRSRPAWVDVVFRTILYSLGVLIVLALEKAFEGRHEHGGFGPALNAVLEGVDMSHVWANTIAVSGALLGYNALSVIRQQLGEGSLARLFLSPLDGDGEKATDSGR